jgi:PKHD-type hydroxylase
MSVYYTFGLPNNNNFAEYIYYENFIMPHEVGRITNFWVEDKIEKAQ